MDGVRFIGRETELATIIDELSESDQFKDPSRIFYIRGQKGIGKKAFYTKLWDRIKEEPMKAVWIRPSSWANTQNVSEWGDLFTACMEGSRNSIPARVANFKEEWAKARHLVPQAAGAPDASTPSPLMDEWVRLFRQYVLNGNGEGKYKTFRIIFALDNYDRLDSSKKEWFSRSIFDQLITDIPEADIRFLLSGEQSFYQTLDLESYWVPFQTEVKELDLPPLTPEETMEFARRANILVSDNYDLHANTGGIPAQIEESLLSGKSTSTGLKKVGEVEQLFQNKSEEHRNWILGAVHLHVFDDESLNIFGTKQGAQKALKWLLDDHDLDVEKHASGYQIKASWSDAILRWQEQYKPDQYRKLADRVEQFREVCELIPKRHHREALAQLSIFNFFNNKIINNVFDADAESMQSFVRNNLNYFIKTPFNYQISMQYQPFVQNYVRLIPFEEKDRYREKAEYFWKKKRLDIEKEAKDISERLQDELDSLDRNKEKLQPIMDQVRRRERAILRKSATQEVKQKKARQAAATQSPKKARLGFSAAGIMLLAYGFLVDGSAWSLIAFGLLFMICGAFWPALEPDLPKKTAKRLKTSPIDDEAEEDTLIRLLNLKRVGLENHGSYLSMQTAKYQRRLRELDTLIEEPYV